MFYSHELLGKKSPLGAVWIAAHGKKLNRNNVMRVNVVDTCEQIINPEVPQALRLQGILIGGVVIVFNRQQSYLLDDCNDTLRKVRAMTIQQSAGTNVLEKGRQQARPEAINVPDLDDLFGGHFNFALMNPLATHVHLDDAPPGDDLFVMPTLPEGSDMHVLDSRHGRQDTNAQKALPLAMAERNTMVLPSGLEPHDTMLMDQEETFMMPELGMEMFDAVMPLLQPEEAVPEIANAEEMLPAQEALAEVQPAVPDLPADAEANLVPGPVPEEVLDQSDAAMQDRQEERSPLQAVVEEQAAAEGAARQARAKGSRRKRAAQIVVDDAGDIQIPGSVFRGWTQDTSELTEQRPHKLLCVASESYVPGSRVLAGNSAHHKQLTEGSLLSIACGHAGLVSPELQELYASGAWRHLLAEERQEPAPEAHAGQPAEDTIPGMEVEFGEGAIPGEEAMLPDGLTAGPDLDLPDQAGPDAFVVEEEIEIERLRAALETPGSMTEQDHAKAIQLGLTPGSSNPPDAKSRKKQKRPSSAFRVDSDTRLTEGERSSPHSQRRLSDLMLGMDGADVGLALEGHYEDLLQPEPDATAYLPDRAVSRGGAKGGLTQYQLMEDSAPATQTQKAVTDAITKSTLSMIGLLRDRFLTMEEEEDDEEPRLSLFQMTGSLTRGQAAKLFYQICVTHSNNFIQARQEIPYGDIIIHKGVCM